MISEMTERKGNVTRGSLKVNCSPRRQMYIIFFGLGEDIVKRNENVLCATEVFPFCMLHSWLASKLPVNKRIAQCDEAFGFTMLVHKAFRI